MKKKTIIAFAVLLVGIIIISILATTYTNPSTKLGMARQEKLDARAKTDSIYRARADSLSSVRAIEQHKRDSAEASRKAYLNRPWKVGQYVDDFGESTGGKFIKYTGSGTFSNSATSGSPLYVKIFCDKSPSVGIFLHEYSWDRSPEKPIGTWTVMMRNSSGETVKFYTGREWNHDGGIALSSSTYSGSSDAQKFVSFFKRSAGTIKFVIKAEYSGSYDFSVNANGFTKEFSLL